MSPSPHASERVGRPIKRRKISKKKDVDHRESPSAHSDSSADDHDRVQKGRSDADKENDKPASKYKIHIPQDDSVPEDLFFTQPPKRSESPYRIENFYWQKPTRPAQVSHASLPDQDHVQLPAIAGKGPAFDAQPTEQRQDKTIHGNADDESDFDPSDEEAFAEVPTHRVSPKARADTDPSQRLLLATGSSHHNMGSDLPNRPVNQGSVFKQTTLFGTQANSNATVLSQTRRKWPMANRQEPPTHHELDPDAMKTWVYPINLGTIRDYQYTITATGLYHNTLVALPTGLGKTFIAATIMLNWYRWTKSAQIVFVAPTKPLVAQQVKACFDIVGIPASQTSMLTGSSCLAALRAEEFLTKRVFFMTPQTLINDLKSGICDPKRVVLIVIDEAHRAKGSYAYVEVVKFVKRFNESFRVLALTATPGGTIEGVQEVIDGLGISRVEIRTEDSLDIRQFVHSRKTETVLFDNSHEMEMVMELFSKALQPSVDKLNGLNAYWSKDPLTLTPYGCNQALKRWMGSDTGRNAQGGLKNMVITTFNLLASLSQATELLKYHGIGPFFQKVLRFRNEIHAGGKKGGKLANGINDSKDFQTLMARVQIWIDSADFIGHPKLEYVQRVVLNHFLDAGEGTSGVAPSNTRIMVFAHFRQSAEEIVRVLKRNEPMIRPHVFVGQSSVKDSEGMDQRKQLDIIDKFQKGVYNTLVATSIGEEGLDIGEVDLIICYDASASPIRMLQRMGRTGRKRAGNIVVTLMRGKEENSFLKAKDNYEKMQHEIASGARFAFHEETVRRIVPKDIQATVDKRVIDIPIENTQAELPVPKKRGRLPKRPPKKFHMPDGVRTGFRKASRLDDDADTEDEAVEVRSRPQRVDLMPIPVLAEVVLTPDEQQRFEHEYVEISGENTEFVAPPLLDRYPQSQRTLRSVKHIGHGMTTRRLVTALSCRGAGIPKEALDCDDRKDIDAQARLRARYFSQRSQPLLDQSQSDVSTHVSSQASSVNTSRPTSVGLERRSFENLSQDYEDQLPGHVKSDTLDDTDDDFPALETMVQSSRQEEELEKVGRRKGGRNVIEEDHSDE